MADISITKMSSKGQIVIPEKIRKGIREGEDFIVIRDRERIILKSTKKFDKNVKEDLEFAKRTEEAWKRIEKNKSERMSFNNFIKDMRKW